MRKHRPSRGLTLLETLILLGIFACVCIMVFPAIQQSREKARQLQCVNNMKMLGMALHNYVQVNKVFPPSSTVTRNANGKITAVDGWSWAVLALPYMEICGVYGSLDIANGRPLAKPTVAWTSLTDPLAISLSTLLCPSFGGSRYANMWDGKAAITNYKGLGSTHIESLSVASPNPLTPKYNPLVKGSHPDGILYPGKSTSFGDIRRGSSNTFLLCESVEPNFSRWTVGIDASVVGLPRNVEFEACAHFPCTIKGLGKLAYHGDSDDQSTYKVMGEVDPVYWTYHTYLDCDCIANPYDGIDGTHGGRYGPSSDHPGVVQHTLGDGSVKAISKDIDVALYMAIIKRTDRN